MSRTHNCGLFFWSPSLLKISLPVTYFSVRRRSSSLSQVSWIWGKLSRLDSAYESQVCKKPSENCYLNMVDCASVTLGVVFLGPAAAGSLSQGKLVQTWVSEGNSKTCMDWCVWHDYGLSSILIFMGRISMLSRGVESFYHGYHWIAFLLGVSNVVLLT